MNRKLRHTWGFSVHRGGVALLGAMAAGYGVLIVSCIAPRALTPGLGIAAALVCGVLCIALGKLCTGVIK
jgi:hypothetical protein